MANARPSRKRVAPVTLASKVRRIGDALGVEVGENLHAALEQANACMGLDATGLHFPDQADRLLASIGIE